MRALAVTGAAVGTLKLVVKRDRPDGGRHSFPSGHAAASMAMAPVITRHLGWRFGLPAYALAAFTGMGRIQERRHHLSDVVWGASIGLAAGIAESQPRPGSALSFEPLLTGDRIGCELHF
jgi:membrane-associated phospholipid phosphatase